MTTTRITHATLSLILALALALVGVMPVPTPALADPADAWWDTAWPYRLQVNVSGNGVASASINFTTQFNTLGQNHAPLDLRSVRVVPYTGGVPGAPLPYAETYSTLL